MSEKKKNWSRIEFIGLAILTIMAGLIRFYKLDAWSYWVDELYTLKGSWLNEVINWHQPFWLITNASIKMFGINAFAIRFFPALFGMISIPLLYRPFKKIVDAKIAFLAVVLLTFSPWNIYLSQLARWYSLLMLVCTLSLVYFYFFVERNSYSNLAISLLLFLFAFALHLTAGFVMVICIVYLFILTRVPELQPDSFNTKRVNVFLISLCGLSLLFIPKFMWFVEKWQSMQSKMGYWGSTPVDFILRTTYQLTPAIAVLALVGIILLLIKKQRAGIFLSLYCLIPPAILVLATIFKVNVSAKYIFFTLPGLLLAASYGCLYLVEQIKQAKFVAWVLVFVAAVLPSLEADFLYFKAHHGNRDRLQEAVQYIHDIGNETDKIMLLYVFENPEEAKFYFGTIAKLNKWEIAEDRYIFPEKPEEIDINERIWVVSIGKTIAPYATGLYKWVSENANLVTEYQASRGINDNTVNVYLHKPNGTEPFFESTY